MRPLDFERFTAPRRVEVAEGTSVADAVREHLRDPVLESLAVVEVDGAEVARADWEGTRLAARSRVRVALRPRGRAAKKVLRTVLLIAVVVVATWITAGGLGAGFAAGSFKAGAAAAAFTAVANLAVNALIPPPGLGDNAVPDVDPTYDLSGTRNRARPGAPIPQVFGTHRYTPDLVTEQYQEVVGDEIWLRFGVCWGVGSYEVDELRIGDTPLADFEGVSVEHQLTPDAPPTTLIRSDFTQDSVGATLGTDWTERRTSADAADAEIILQFPRGLGTTDKKGRPEAVSVSVDVRVRVVDTDGTTVSDWTDTGTGDPTVADAAARGVDSSIASRTGLYEGTRTTVDVFGIYTFEISARGGGAMGRTFRRSDTKPFSASIPIALPPGRQYDIAVRRTSPADEAIDVADEVAWVGLTTYQAAPIILEPRLATTFFRLKAQEELSGFVDELNGRAHRLVRTYAGPEDPGLAAPGDWTQARARSTNPADTLLEILQGAHRARPTPDDGIHWGDLAEFFLWCRDEGFTFSLPMDGATSVGEALDVCARAGRARVYRHAGRIRIAIDRPRLAGPDQILTPRNARNFSFTRSFATPVHAFRMAFVNAEDDYRADELMVYADGFGPDTATLIEDVSAPGMLHPAEVFRYGSYLMAQTRLRTLSASCEMDIEAGTLRLGAYVRTAHPVLDSTVHTARVESVAGREVRLDAAPEAGFLADQDYVLRHRRIVEVDGEAHLDCEGLYPLEPLSGRPNRVTLEDDLPPGVELEPDDLVVVGIMGQDSFEGLVRDIEPTGPAEARVELVAYLPETLVAPDAPPHVPTGRDPFRPVPAPILVATSATETDATVAFAVAESLSGRLAAVRVRHRQAALPGEGGAFARAPDLAPDERAATVPLAAPDQAVEVELVCVDTEGRRSAPLSVITGDPDLVLPAPSGVTVTPGTAEGLGGSVVPVLDIEVEPVDTTRLSTLVVEAASPGGDDWSIVGTASSAQARARVLGLPPGTTLDIRLAWQSPRGVLTPEALRPVVAGVAIPATFKATDVETLDGRALDSFLQQFDALPDTEAVGAAVDAASDALAEAIDEEFGDLAGPGGRVATVEQLAEGTRARLDLVDYQDADGAARIGTLEEARAAQATRTARLEARSAGRFRAGGGNLTFADPSEWSRSVNNDDIDHHLALIPSEVQVLKGEAAYVTSRRGLVGPRYASRAEGGDTIELRVALDVLSGGTAGGTTLRLFARCYDSDRVALGTPGGPVLFLAPGSYPSAKVQVGLLAGTAFYRYYVFHNTLAGEDAEIAVYAAEWDVVTGRVELEARADILEQQSALATLERAEAREERQLTAGLQRGVVAGGGSGSGTLTLHDPSQWSRGITSSDMRDVAPITGVAPHKGEPAQSASDTSHISNVQPVRCAPGDLIAVSVPLDITDAGAAGSTIECRLVFWDEDEGSGQSRVVFDTHVGGTGRRILAGEVEAPSTAAWWRCRILRNRLPGEDAVVHLYGMGWETVTRVAAAEAAVSQSAAAVATVEGLLDAYHLVETDAGGAISRIVQRSVSDGTTSFSDIFLLADRIRLLGGGALFQLLDGLARLNAPLEIEGTDVYLRIRAGGVQVVLGPGFGANGDLAIWWGAERPVDQCTRTNGVRAFTLDAGSYLYTTREGGQARSNAASGSDSAEMTNQASNGNAVDVSASGTLSASEVQFTGSATPPWSTGGAPAQTLVLERRVDSGAWQQVDSDSSTGTASYQTVQVSHEPGAERWEHRREFAVSSSLAHTEPASAPTVHSYGWRVRRTSESLPFSASTRTVQVAFVEP